MKKSVPFAFLFALCAILNAQNTIEPTINDTFTWADRMPEYPGGHNAMMTFMNANLNYPAISKENGIKGRVIIQLIINNEGLPVNMKVLKSPNEELAKEAIRLITLMPNWIPGKQNGEPVAVKFTLPIVFKLNE